MSDDPDDDDDLLSQAEQETANALTRGQCCASETRPPRFQIISNLLCDACQDMSFRVGNVLINGALYRKVAEALRDPGHKLHIKIDTNLKKNVGEYNRGVFTFQFAGISSKTDEGASNCETIIHECTHACVDYTRGLQVLRTDNEIAAWFGGVLFLRGQGLPIAGELNFRKNLRALANDARKANVRGQTFTLPPTAVAALKSDIVHSYHISESLTDVGRGF